MELGSRVKAGVVSEIHTFDWGFDVATHLGCVPRSDCFAAIMGRGPLSRHRVRLPGNRWRRRG